VSKHTPGPWASVHDADGDYLIMSPESGRFIAVTYTDAEQDEANARLIAAAPEMLEALERILPSLQGTGHANTVRAVIRKAKGEL
jgi:hypothetical protein